MSPINGIGYFGLDGVTISWDLAEELQLVDDLRYHHVLRFCRCGSHHIPHPRILADVTSP